MVEQLTQNKSNISRQLSFKYLKYKVLAQLLFSSNSRQYFVAFSAVALLTALMSAYEGLLS